MTLTPRHPDAETFSPFGAFVLPPERVGDRALFGEWLSPVAGLSQQCHINRVAPSVLPLTIDTVEHHPHASQVFLPIGVSRYLVTVMPSTEAGAPDTAGAVAFVVPGTVGVAYRPGVWHTGIAVLDNEASFAVLMWRGREDDDVFASVDPIRIAAEAAGAASHG